MRDAAGARFDDIELQIRTFLASVTDAKEVFYEQYAPLFRVDDP